MKRDPCATVGSVLGILKCSTSPTCSFFHFSIPYKNPRPDKAVSFFSDEKTQIRKEKKNAADFNTSKFYYFKIFHWCRAKENRPAISSQWARFPVFSRLIPQSMRLRVLVSSWLLVLFIVMCRKGWMSSEHVRQKPTTMKKNNIHAAKTLILELLKSTTQEGTIEIQVVS